MRTVPQAAAQDSDQSFLGSVRLHFSKFRLAVLPMKISSTELRWQFEVL